MSSTVNTVPPYVFESKGTFPAPFTFDVPASLEVRPDTATARFDGTGAGGNFLACLTFYGSDGERLGRWFNPTVLAPGQIAEVTYTPPFGSAASNAAPGAGIMFDTFPQSGKWLDIETTGNDAHGFGFDLEDSGGGGIQLETTVGSHGNVNVIGDGGVFLTSNANITLYAYSVLSLINDEAAGFLEIGQKQGGQIDIHGDGAHVTRINICSGGATDRLGFFGVAAVPKQATPVTLANVISLLQAYGLSA